MKNRQRNIVHIVPLDARTDPDYVNNIVVEPVSPIHVTASDEVKRIIAELLHYNSGDKEALWICDTLDGSRFTERIFLVMTSIFGAVALLTLALREIGVMNIILVTLTERTREIGIRKAS